MHEMIHAFQGPGELVITSAKVIMPYHYLVKCKCMLHLGHPNPGLGFRGEFSNNPDSCSVYALNPEGQAEILTLKAVLTLAESIVPLK